MILVLSLYKAVLLHIIQANWMVSPNKDSHNSSGSNLDNSMNYHKKIWITITKLRLRVNKLGTIKVLSTCRFRLPNQYQMQGLLSKCWKEEWEAKVGMIKAISEKKTSIKTIKLSHLLITTIVPIITPFLANRLQVIWCKLVILVLKDSLAHNRSSLPCNSFTHKTFMIFP